MFVVGAVVAIDDVSTDVVDAIAISIDDVSTDVVDAIAIAIADAFIDVVTAITVTATVVGAMFHLILLL